MLTRTGGLDGERADVVVELGAPRERDDLVDEAF
jgi:hypothetical protein